MSLMFTGNRVSTLEGVNFQAKDGDGVEVAVALSHEVIADEGEAAAMTKAMEKYDAGDFTDGAPRKVSVRTADFSAS